MSKSIVIGYNFETETPDDASIVYHSAPPLEHLFIGQLIFDRAWYTNEDNELECVFVRRGLDMEHVDRSVEDFLCRLSHR